MLFYGPQLKLQGRAFQFMVRNFKMKIEAMRARMILGGWHFPAETGRIIERGCVLSRFHGPVDMEQ